MSSERIDPQFHDAVVTYSRVPSRERGFTQDPVPAARREPTLDAAEIHVLDERDFGARAVNERDDSELDFGVRSERADDGLASAVDLGLDEKRKRSPMARIVFTTAALSIVAGVGVLAATVGVATITPSRTPAAQAPVAPPTLAAVDPQNEVAPASAIREIPLATDKDAAPADAASVAPTEAAPPLPRSRPETTESAAATPAPVKAEPEAAKIELRPSAEPVKPADAILPPPQKSVPTLPPPAPAAQATPASAPAGNTDALISRIEETLAKRDAAGALPPGALDPHGMEVLPEGEGPVAVLPPPASMAPNYPQVGRTYRGPSSEGPTYDLVPPEPITGNGYGNTYPPPAYPAEALPSGPTPPADVPYGYPSRPMNYEMVPEKKPGFLKRTWMRTADAVKGVFTRDETPPN